VVPMSSAAARCYGGLSRGGASGDDDLAANRRDENAMRCALRGRKNASSCDKSSGANSGSYVGPGRESKKIDTDLQPGSKAIHKWSAAHSTPGFD
jgi:hypothetical protein